MDARPNAINKGKTKFYSLLGLAGCAGALGFIALGLYGIASSRVLKADLFAAGLVLSGALLGNRCVRFLQRL